MSNHNAMSWLHTLGTADHNIGQGLPICASAPLVRELPASDSSDSIHSRQSPVLFDHRSLACSIEL